MSYLFEFLKKRINLLALMLSAAVFLILCIGVFNYASVKNLLSKSANEKSAVVLENSARGRRLVELFSDINLLEHAYLGENNLLQSESIRLPNTLKTIIENTNDVNLNKILTAVLNDLNAYLDAGKDVNRIFDERSDIHDTVQGLLKSLEASMGRSLVQQTLNNEDTTFIEQLLILVVGYHETLLEITIFFSESNSGNHFDMKESLNDQLIHLVDDLILRLQTVTASVPDIAKNGAQIIKQMKTYKQILLRYYTVLENLNRQKEKLALSQGKLLSEMNFFDEAISKTMQALHTKIVKTMLISTVVVLSLTMGVVILLGFLVVKLFKSMDRESRDRKQAEKETIIAQRIAGEHKKMALVGQIAGKMAHDFNNILGIIMGNAQIALMDCTDPAVKKTLELIFNQTIRGKNLTKNLVAFAKNQEPKQDFFKLNEKVGLVVSLLKKGLEKIELIREEAPGLPEILADPGMIEHSLVNLIQNSIHAVGKTKTPKITLRTYSLEENICFEVEDNGCGIPEEHLKNVFEPSFTLKGNKDIKGVYEKGVKGTGYGLSNVKKYIDQHKGDIRLYSRPGSGTKITVCLPFVRKSLTPEEKNKITVSTLHTGKFVLLVEDEPSIANVQCRILSQDPCHHKVDVAPNGQIAVDLFNENTYDVVSLDYVLPGDMNGMDVYHHIRKTHKTIPILFISGNIEFLESIKELAIQDPFIEHLSKPCQNEDYVSSLNKLIQKNLSETR